ncbi:hypothetical protein [Aquibaculum sediminis]|uniref:hypothetical protein n=1 Tax=Aquibaculum sediminis TaxID=3231907 RepID=UPI00345214C9
MKHVFSAAAVAAVITASLPALAQDLEFMLSNKSGYALFAFYASPTTEASWEEDILGAGILNSGESMRITIADRRRACDYDLRMEFTDGDVLEDTVDLCEVGSYTIE